jgi:hypothetical protein
VAPRVARAAARAAARVARCAAAPAPRADHGDFTDELATLLLGMEYDQTEEDNDEAESSLPPGTVHEAGKFDAKGNRTRDPEKDLSRQQKCVWCLRVNHTHVFTSYYCKTCAVRADGPSQAALCCPTPTEVKQCMLKHITLGIPTPPSRAPWRA